MFNVVVFELPDVLTQCCCIAFVFVFEAGLVKVVSCFECAFCETGISFLLFSVCACDCGLVD